MTTAELKRLWNELHLQHESLFRNERFTEAAMIAEQMAEVCKRIELELRCGEDGTVRKAA